MAAKAKRIPFMARHILHSRTRRGGTDQKFDDFYETRQPENTMTGMDLTSGIVAGHHPTVRIGGLRCQKFANRLPRRRRSARQKERRPRDDHRKQARKIAGSVPQDEIPSARQHFARAGPLSAESEIFLIPYAGPG